MSKQYWKETEPGRITALALKVNGKPYSDENSLRLDIYSRLQMYESWVYDNETKEEKILCSQDESQFEAAATLGQMFRLVRW